MTHTAPIDLPPESDATTRDRALYEAGSASGGNNNALIALAAKLSGQSPLAIGRDIMRHARSGRGIEVSDYLRYQLWDRDLHPGDAADRFVGAATAWPVAHAVNSKSWWSAAEDKFAMSQLLAADGLPQPETVAVIDTASARSYGRVARIETGAALRDVVLSRPAGSLFAKTLDGMVGSGALALGAADASGLEVPGYGRLAYDEVISRVFGDAPYLLQTRLKNHPALAPFCTGLTTVRLPAFVMGRDVAVPMAVMKLATAGNEACAFWRPGNLVCGLDVDTGEVTRVAGRDGPRVAALPDHPERPGLTGLALPFWQQVRELHERAVRLFGGIAYQSTDIAITPDGPVLVELNYAGSFDVLQNGTGKGLLQPEVRDFFAFHGQDFAPKRRGLLRGITGRR
ncbi:sugar-transfer associated ATP-grasp domain-containing protein [Rhodosalinus sp. K401]|uniref:sugar-transfer associated ATP-grasp domain-containing protein n=1 Tax=Rhodosalinus sp. K401 TaxID=3239195 RepID=UPI003526284D